MSNEVVQSIRKILPHPLPNRPLPSQAGEASDSQPLSPPIRHSITNDEVAEASIGSEFTSCPFSPTSHGDSESEEEAPPIPERHYSSIELGLEDEPPPLPERLYTWSDVEDNDEEVLQIDDDLDDSTTSLSPSDQQAIDASSIKARTNKLSLRKQLKKKTDREMQRRRKQEAKQRRKEEEKSRRKGQKTRNKVPERKRYFGSALETVAGEDGIPIFIRNCAQFLENTGLKSEGLYRVAGRKDDCLTLQAKVDEDFNLDLANLDYDECTVSSTLKAFFKLLPDPLISNDIAAKILDINSLQLDAQLVKLQEMLSTMPHPNLCTLHFLLAHLNKVQSLQKENRMTASNLAIVFWPTLMRPPLMDLANPSKQMGWQLAMTRLIEQPDCVPLPQ